MTAQEQGLLRLKQHILESLAPSLSTSASEQQPSGAAQAAAAGSAINRTQLEQQLRHAAAVVDDTATKFAIAYRGPPENPEECVPLADMLGDHLTAFCSALLALSSISCGSLSGKLRSLCGGVLDSVVQLTDWFINQKNEKREVAPVVAVVWEYCKVIKEIDLDDRLAASSEMMQWLPAIKDAIEELESIEAKEGDDGDDDDGDDGDDENKEDDVDDEDDDHSEMTEEELQIRPAVVEMCKVASMAIQKANNIVKGSRVEMGMVPVLDELVAQSKRASELVDETVCSVYEKPQERGHIVENATTLCGVIRKICQAGLSDKLAPEEDSEAASKVEGDKKLLTLLLAKSEQSLKRF